MRQSKRLTILAVSAVALTLTACGGDDDVAVGEAVAQPPAAVVEAPDYGLVTPAQAADLATRTDVTVIDVRTPDEFAEGHIAGATLVDYYDPSFAQQIAELDPNGEYLIYCRSGNRSGQAYALMAELGFSKVYDLDGGVIAYDAAGLPLQK